MNFTLLLTFRRQNTEKTGGAVMKWIAGISLAVAMLMFNIPARAGDGWSAAEHDYHVANCSHARQRAGTNDAPDCQNFTVGTSHGCCCDTCDSYFDECRGKELPQDVCERIKAKCQRDCNVFVSSSSAGS
jgi:hypothetical protein